MMVLDLPKFSRFNTNAKLHFTHKVFGDDINLGYRVNTVVNLSVMIQFLNHIWKLVCINSLME
jgi:hypothetical protein